MRNRTEPEMKQSPTDAERDLIRKELGEKYLEPSPAMVLTDEEYEALREAYRHQPAEAESLTPWSIGAWRWLAERLSARVRWD